jgi:NAD(P)H-dependent FMN reductase
MYNVKLITASTRPGRKGPAVAAWMHGEMLKHSELLVESLDLAEINLPFLDEAEHPRFKKYEKEHTKSWSKTIDGADAYIIVTPEYNYGFPAPLKNALDFLYHEWSYKPVAFVSYGGLAGGTRSVQMLKQVVTAMKMMPIVESVNIPAFTKHIDEKGVFKGDERLDKGAHEMILELLKWTKALKGMRQEQQKK